MERNWAFFYLQIRTWLFQLAANDTDVGKLRKRFRATTLAVHWEDFWISFASSFLRTAIQNLRIENNDLLLHTTKLFNFEYEISTEGYNIYTYLIFSHMPTLNINHLSEDAIFIKKYGGEAGSSSQR